LKQKQLKSDGEILMFFMPRFLQFDSANTVLNRGNATPNKERGPFSDTGDISTDEIIANSLIKPFTRSILKSHIRLLGLYRTSPSL
jgi:hypothetical protein